MASTMTPTAANTLLPLAVLGCSVKHISPAELLPYLKESWPILNEESRASIHYRAEEAVKWKHQHWEVWREVLGVEKEEDEE